MIPLRDDTPCAITPVVTIGVLIACVFVFFWQQTLTRDAQQLAVFIFGLIPAALLQDAQLPPALTQIPAEMTVFTSMFLHGGWMHLIGNMLYLWIFGNNVEDAMGHGRFVAFYLLCGIAAALAQAMPDPSSTIPMIGASGAVSGLLGAYLLLYPHARVLVLVPLGFLTQLVHIPAVWLLGLWFLLQLLSNAMTPTTDGGVAFGAHIGGFIAGMALVPFFKQRRVRLFNPAHRR